MQPFQSAFSSLTFLLLLVSLAIFAVPSMAEETIPFSRSGRVVNERVPRLLKHYRPRRPFTIPLDSRTYGDNQGDDDNHGHGGGHDDSGHGYGSGDDNNHGGYGGGNDNGHGGYGSGNDNGHGGYGGGNDNGHGGYGGGNDNGHGGYGGGDDSGHGGYGGGDDHHPPVYGHPSQGLPKPTPTPYPPPSHGGSHGY